MNDLMSFGIHRCWKKTFIDDVGVLKSRNIAGKEFSQVKIIDVAAGTGDISLSLLEKHKQENLFLGDKGIQVSAVDIN